MKKITRIKASKRPSYHRRRAYTILYLRRKRNPEDVEKVDVMAETPKEARQIFNNDLVGKRMTIVAVVECSSNRVFCT